MEIWSAFFRVLPRDPSRALAALGWWLRGKRQRARNRLRIAPDAREEAYQTWIVRVEARRAAPAGFEKHAVRIAVPADATAPLGVQIAAGGDYLLLAAPGATLASDARERFAEALRRHPDATALYADADTLAAHNQRTRPWLKPAWDPDRFLAQDYLSQIFCISVPAARAAQNFAAAHPEAETYALLLAATASARATVIHVPHILAHLPLDHVESAQAARRNVVAAHLAHTGAVALPGPWSTLRIDWPLPPPADLPLVSIIIPTRDRADLLATAANGVLETTDYPAVELIIVDNGSRESGTARLLTRLKRDPRVRVLRDDGAFNFSRLNNAAAQIATGQFLCLLNNDIEITSPDWLTALVRQALRPGIGAVGAKLLYPDQTIQHAGVVVGLGDGAGHAHRFQPDAAEGWFADAHVAHRTSAVTAACLVVEATKYHAVGGLDEGFAVAFNDVDFCLKLNAAGWRTVYEPAARLIHHESQTRDAMRGFAQAARFERERALLAARWPEAAAGDPASETYRLKI